MRSLERISRSLRRTDVRAGTLIGGALLLAIAVQGWALYAYVEVEALEQADLWLDRSLEFARAEVDEGESRIDSALASLQQLGLQIRVRDDAEKIVREWGEWPPENRVIALVKGDDQRAWWSFGLLDPDDYIIGREELASGRSIEIALSLKAFAAEAKETGSGIALIALVTGIGAFALAFLATSHAFDPLRRATALLDESDVRRLERLPTRGTNDPVDRHAEAFNRTIEAIETSMESLRYFSSEAAHELRTPLNRIGNIAEIALRQRDPKGHAAALSAVCSTVTQISGSVQSLLLLAEIDGHRLLQDSGPLDLDALIRRVVETYSPLFELEKATLTLHGSSGAIEGDRQLLDRVFANLLDNALQHAAGGRVELRCVSSESGVTIQLDDAGSGIPVADRERVFERFVRLDRSPGRKGSGLGLAVARSIARAHGGELHVSDSPLGGARFTLSLPRKQGVPSREPTWRATRYGRIATISDLEPPR